MLCVGVCVYSPSQSSAVSIAASSSVGPAACPLSPVWRRPACCCLLAFVQACQDGYVTCMSWFPHTETVGRDGMVLAADIRMLAVGYSSGKVMPTYVNSR